MHKWKNTLLKPSSSMEDAIKVLGSEALRIAIIVDEKDTILGIVTDGDLRRALVKGHTIKSHVCDFMRRKPLVAPSDISRMAVIAMMKEKDILVIPVVDKKNRVVGVENLTHLLDKKNYDNPIFLMAGGFGKRLSPLTDDIPKPLLKIGSNYFRAIYCIWFP